MKSQTKKLDLSWRAWKRLPAWIAEPKLVWAFLFVLAGSCLVGDWIGEALAASQQDRIRYAGWVLDICGHAMVAVGLTRKLNIFQGENVLVLLVKGLKSWLRQLPIIQRDIVVHTSTGQAMISPITASGRARVTVGVSPEASMEQKVAFLLRRNDEVTDQLFNVIDALSSDRDGAKEESGQLRAFFKEEIKKLESLTVEAHVGEIGWEFVGLVWIFLGITFATVPEFIEYLFGWLINWFQVI